MKLKHIILALGLATPLITSAQPNVMRIDAQGYFERGRMMYETHNYVGAIDQLSHLLTMDPSIELEEQASLLLAFCKFERDQVDGLDALVAFIEEYPTSTLVQQAQMKIGDYYLYHSDWDNALLSYSLVRPRALDLNADENLLYRQAYCNLRTGNYALAETQYSQLARTKRYGDASVFYKAYIEYAQGDYDSALERFKNIDATTELGYQAQYYITQIKYKKQRYGEVIAAGRQLLAEENNDYFTAELNRMVGESFYHEGDHQQARVYLRRYLDNPDGDIHRTAAYTMGVLDYYDRNYSQTANYMTMATDQDDALAQSAWLFLGQSKLQMKDLNGAARAFEQAAQMKHDANVRETACYNYAISQHLGAKTPFGKSTELFEQFLNDYPHSKYRTKVEGYLVDSYFTTSDYEKVLASINRIKSPGKQVQRAKQNVLYNLGMQALNNGNVPLAIDRLQQAVNLGNLDKDALNESRLWLAEAQYRAGNFKEATAQQQQYVKSAGQNDQNYGIAQYNLGYSLFQQRQYAEAQKAFRNALDSKQLSAELSADAYNRIGDTQYYAQEFGAAQRSYGQAMATDKNSPQDYSAFQQGVMMGMNKQWDEQIAHMNDFVKQYPRSQYAPQALLEKAAAQVAKNDLNSAISTYSALRKAYPKSAEARKALLLTAMAYQNMGDNNNALKTFKEVVKAYPSSDEARAAVEDLKLAYAERDDLAQLEKFLHSIPGAPHLDVSEVDRLTFEVAEKDIVGDNPSVEKMQQYLNNYPNGAYARKAQYYLARYHYQKGSYDQAMSLLEQALNKGGDADFAEDAMAIRSDILVKQGKNAEALKEYQQLAEKASNDDTRTIARLGALRVAQDMNKWDVVKTEATALLGAGNISAAEEREATMALAMAAKHTGDTSAAEEHLKKLAEDMLNEEGARAAVELATMQLEAGNIKAADKTVTALIDSDTPHDYWLARGYLIKCDIFVKQGKKGDARDYLQSLKNNYPGKEKDIADGINSRLNALKKGK